MLGGYSSIPQPLGLEHTRDEVSPREMLLVQELLAVCNLLMGGCRADRPGSGGADPKTKQVEAQDAATSENYFHHDSGPTPGGHGAEPLDVLKPLKGIALSSPT
ncbi:hypothetical protein llap_16136 [Limosa lapponica baueri]|uniref:Uncharacterized protein n=1 Tax=Limosa lapponica baueri TaxID=1758121 RepID=A0A2I0TIC3_LIMLA|nr:hypothetical protein llap_16136 [Limosa lapponica baueri]